MQLEVVFKVLLIGYCIFSSVFIIVLMFKTDFETDVEEVLDLYKAEKKRTYKDLEINNKRINDLNKKIKNLKKALNQSKVHKQVQLSNKRY